MNNYPIIICVDDENIILKSLKEQLKSFYNGEVHVETAESGEEALELIDELIKNNLEPNLIISDQIMPGMKGNELLTKINEKCPRTNKVLLTGLADKDDIINAVNNGNLYRYIAKPWDKEDLNLTVREAVNAYTQDLNVVKKTAELEALNNLLNISNAELDTLLYKSSHDLKSPITTLKGLCNLGLIENDTQYYRVQEEVINRMLLLLKKIVKIGEIRNKNVILETVILKDLINENINGLFKAYKKADFNLSINVDSVVLCDRPLLNVIINNVIHNALTYSSYTREKTIDIRSESIKNKEVLYIKNSCPSSSKVASEEIFKMFYRGNDHNNGFGLGLYISKVAARRGDISLEIIKSDPEVFELSIIMNSQAGNT